MASGLGVVAALGAPLFRTTGLFLWDHHWKGGAFALNMFQCNVAVLAVVVLLVVSAVFSEVTGSDPLLRSDLFTAETVGFLFLSSFVGIMLGDSSKLIGLQRLGHRRLVMIDSLKPFCAAYFGWFFLGEDLRPAAFGGITLTAMGILVMALEKTKNEVNDDKSKHKEDRKEEETPSTESPVSTTEDVTSSEDGPQQPGARVPLGTKSSGTITTTDSGAVALPPPRRKSKTSRRPSVGAGERRRKKEPPTAMRGGYLFAFLNVIFDTTGSVLTKRHGRGMNVWEINLIRSGFAGIAFLTISAVMRVRARMHRLKESSCTSCTEIDIEQQPGQQQAGSRTTEEEATPWYSLPTKNMTRSSWLHTACGAILVTFTATTLYTFSFAYIALALAMTFDSIGPLYSLPLSFFVQGERPTTGAVLGAFFAVSGVIVLAFKGIPEDPEN